MFIPHEQARESILRSTTGNQSNTVSSNWVQHGFNGLSTGGFPQQGFSVLTTQNGLSPDTLNDLSRKATGHGRSPQDVFAAVQMQHASLIQNGFFTPSTRPEDLSTNPQEKDDSLAKDLNKGLETMEMALGGAVKFVGTIGNAGVDLMETLAGTAGRLSDAVADSSNKPAISDSATEDSSRMLPSTHPRQNIGAIRMGDETGNNDSSCSSARSENRPENRKGFTSGTHEYDRGSSNQPTTVFEKRVTEESSRSSPTHPQVAQGIEGLGNGLMKTFATVGQKLAEKVSDAVKLSDEAIAAQKLKDSCKRRVRIGAVVGIASILFLALSVTQQTGKFTFIESLPSKANLAITIASGLIIALSIAFVAYYKWKENDCDTKLSNIKDVQRCFGLGQSA